MSPTSCNLYNFCPVLRAVTTVFRITTLSIAGIVWLASKVDTKVGYFFFIVLTCLISNLFVTWFIENIRTEIEYQTVANQGIKNSWGNITWFTLVVLILSSLFGWFYQFKVSIYTHLQFEASLFISFVIYIIGVAFFEGGGKALIQHFALRLVLAAYRYVPLRYDLLLNYCTERLLLQRIGGRYRFMHKLLQDYFARMELD